MFLSSGVNAKLVWLISYCSQYDSCVSPCITRHWHPHPHPLLTALGGARQRWGRAPTRTLRFEKSPHPCECVRARHPSVVLSPERARTRLSPPLNVFPASAGLVQTPRRIANTDGDLTDVWWPPAHPSCAKAHKSTKIHWHVSRVPSCALMGSIEQPAEKEVCLDITGKAARGNESWRETKEALYHCESMEKEVQTFCLLYEERKLKWLLTIKVNSFFIWSTFTTCIEINGSNWFQTAAPELRSQCFKSVGIYWTNRHLCIFNDKLIHMRNLYYFYPVTYV